MVSTKKKRVKIFFKLFNRVKKSKSTEKDYFSTHSTPIGIRQYSRLKKCYRLDGKAGLADKRCQGNARKLTQEQSQMLRGIFAYNRHLFSTDLQYELQSQWEIKLSTSRINQLRRQLKLSYMVSQKAAMQEMAPLAGIEIFAAIAQHTGIMEHWNRTIQERLHQVKQSEYYGDGRGTGDHIHARRRNGTFSPRYNQLAHVRQNKFLSVSDKVKDKDFSCLSLYERKINNFNRKNLAVLLLPLVTNNGAMRSLDKPLGNALQYACGYNYKNATIDKYLRELKYLQVSSELINCNARFWSKFWEQYDSTNHKIAYYYIDGNVKPLW
ncbi:MAG: hypothetical protein HY841_07345 [Bacteroidetes bacterium]|nr:hypothetical protein [Bacteroidota bacterium]